ncbi:MAG TPA: heme exporter protein CcmB [Chryseosolibacter sp.]|nr:heme exporter protein CcmB [Chryseosolibacter sp.]
MALKVLILNEITLELRRKSVISGILLYLFCLIFICYLTFNLQRNTINPASWSALFWLTILFAVINSVAKSFIGEKKGLAFYLYYLASPQLIIAAKIIYNSILAFLLSLSGYGLFAVLIGDQVGDRIVFLATLVLTSIGLASVLSLISSIAAKTNHSNVLMAVLSFPVVIGILLMAVKITKNVIDGLDITASYDELLNLLAINCILTGLAYLLFPYIWRS